MVHNRVHASTLEYSTLGSSRGDKPILPTSLNERPFHPTHLSRTDPNQPQIQACNSDLDMSFSSYRQRHATYVPSDSFVRKTTSRPRQKDGSLA